MLIFKPADFAKANITGIYRRYFIQHWVQLLDYKCPPTARARHMNGCSILGELNALAKAALRGEKVKNYLRASAEEAIHGEWGLLKQGPLFKDVCSQEWYLLEPLIKTLATGDDLKPEKIKVLRDLAACGRVKLQEAYQQDLPGKIFNILFSEEDSPLRTLNRLSSLTRVQVSHLLTQGHSPNVLFNRYKLFMEQERRSERDRAEYFLGIAGFVDVRHSVVFQLDLPRDVREDQLARSAPPLDTEVRVENECPSVEVEDYPWLEERIDRFSEKREGRVWVTVGASARDAYAAALEGYSIFRQWLVAVRFREQFRNLLPPKSGCLVYEAENPANAKVLDIADIETREKDPTLFHHAQNKLWGVLGRGDFWGQHPAVFRYLEALHESEKETSFDLFWRAMELLSAEQEGDFIIERVVDAVARPLALRAAKRSLRFTTRMLNNIEDVHLDELPDCSRSLSSHHANALQEWARFFAEESSADALYDMLENYEVARMWVWRMHKLFRDQANVVKRLERSRTSIEWQLRRIYRFRNMIMHRGHTTKPLHRLHQHLRWYNYSLFDMIAGAESCLGTKYLRIENQRYDSVVSELKKGKADLHQLFI